LSQVDNQVALFFRYEDCHPRMSLSGIHDISRLEAVFPIRIASGMTVLGTGGRLTLVRFRNYLRCLFLFVHELSTETVFAGKISKHSSSRLTWSELWYIERLCDFSDEAAPIHLFYCKFQIFGAVIVRKSSPRKREHCRCGRKLK